MTPTEIARRIQDDCATLAKAFIDAGVFEAAVDLLTVAVRVTPCGRKDFNQSLADQMRYLEGGPLHAEIAAGASVEG